MGASPVVRKNVHQLGGDWADEVLWYARGVGAMQKRALNEPTSWRFYAGIHGFDVPGWQALGALTPADVLPTTAVRRRFWLQCQHGSWYFLPWHRGYLWAFEAVVRKEITDLGGPADWALPYWNYFNPGEDVLPPAFGSPDWPDGTGNNPLYLVERYGVNGDGNVVVPTSEINLDALGNPVFTGVGGGGDPGFGGVDTGFSHGGQVHGALESQPHDPVHVLVGWFDPATGQPGAMTSPATAGLDPIFWLHHANIDRLWPSWLADFSHTDPTNSRWLTGPMPPQRGFAMPLPDGTTWFYAAQDVLDTEQQLNYVYDDLTPGPGFAPVPVAPAPAAEGDQDMAAGQNIELMGSNDAAVPIVGDGVRTTVQLDPPTRDKVTASFAAARGGPAIAAESASAATLDRVFLNLENVRSSSDGYLLQVYVAVPAGQDPAEHPECRAGSIGLFGVAQASKPDGEHGGAGLTYVMDITGIVDDLHLRDGLDDTLPVTIVPLRPVSADSDLTVGRVNVYRQGD